MKAPLQEIGRLAVSALSRNVALTSIFSGIMLVALGAYVVIVLERRMQEEVNSRLEIAAAGLRASLVEKISQQTHLSESFGALIEADESFVDPEFEKLAAILLRDRPEVINVAIAPNLVVSHVFPVEPNQGVIGLDLSERSGGDVARTALRRNQTLIEGPVVTVQGPKAFITRTPVRLNTGDSPAVWGMVSVVVHSDAILEHAFELERSGYFDIIISEVGRDSLLFGSSRPEEAIFASFPLGLEGIDWQVEVFPTHRLLTEVSWEHRAVLTAFSALIIPLVGLLIFYALHVRIVGRLKSLLSDSINAIDDGFVIYDPQDRFVLCNDAYKRMYEKSADLFVPGIPFSHIIREGVKRGQYTDAIGREEEFIRQRLEAHDAATSTTTQRLPDGTFLKISERKTSDGSLVGFRVDITELEKARAAAEEAFQVKSEFISVLSHELRTPLTVILGYAKVMANVALLKSAQKLETLMVDEEPDIVAVSEALDHLLHQVTMYANKMESSGSHLLTLINDLLDYSKIEQGHFQLQLEEFSLKSIVAAVVEDMSDLASEKGVMLIDETQDAALLADKIRFKQVMINLIGNAIKFTDYGSIIVRTSLCEDAIEITVSDTGRGIPHEKLGRIFEAFQQADLSDRRSAGGTGLGLAISRTITEMHGGKLSVTSEVGVGSTFTVRLPLEKETIYEISQPRNRLSRPLVQA